MIHAILSRYVFADCDVIHPHTRGKYLKNIKKMKLKYFKLESLN